MNRKKEVHVCSLVDRPNRFLGRVEFEGNIHEVFIPNPGRMHELMIPGKEVYIRDAASKNRKTAYDMIGVKHAGVLISIDSLLPNRFMKRIFTENVLKEFREFTEVKPEPRVYEGRFDFKLNNGKEIAYVEVKSCTLIEDGRAIFPDAPTSRGARHVNSLARVLREGLAQRAAIVFVIQRPDAIVFSPNDRTDPLFGECLRRSAASGVEVYALSTEVLDWNLHLIGPVPIELNHFSESL
ncbi:MAG: DNA/RNA nuclease SfsA [Candidatus Thorarchaeota archaeon]|nr:DNA/RNA nuclease SfsA [Candidatus Thorarchaeota archaeon]